MLAILGEHIYLVGIQLKAYPASGLNYIFHGGLLYNLCILAGFKLNGIVCVKPKEYAAFYNRIYIAGFIGATKQKLLRSDGKLYLLVMPMVFKHIIKGYSAVAQFQESIGI